MSERKRGRPVTHGAVRCEETGVIFRTYQEAADRMGLCRVGVSRAARGIQKHHHGWHFSISEEQEVV